MQLSMSQRVLHEKYGLGVISELDQDYTVVEFDAHGPKKFITKLVSLAASDEPKPKRRRRARSKTTEEASETKKKTSTRKTKKSKTKKKTKTT